MHYFFQQYDINQPVLVKCPVTAENSSLPVLPEYTSCIDMKFIIF